MSADEITKHFGIAPLTQPIPPGLASLSVSPETALAMTFPEKPYWAFVDGWVTVITDDRPDAVAKALYEHTPHGGDRQEGPVEAPGMIVLPFPPASLSGHAKGHWRSKSTPTAKHREWAMLATLAANITVPSEGDIRLHVRFTPPDRRGDRANFPVRMKAYFDGIADGLGVNDRRFVPSYEFLPPAKPGWVSVSVVSA